MLNTVDSMHDFLIELQDEYDQIAETQIDALEPGLSKDEVVASCKKIGKKLRSFRVTTAKIIQESLFPMLEDIGSISDEDEEALYTTAQKISAYETRADPGLALKIYQGLLKWARDKGDSAKILKYLYWCGITLYFFSPEDKESTLAYFEEGASYKDKYSTFDDPETRKYIHRCIGNTSMVYYSMDMPEKAAEVDEMAFSFWNGLIFADNDTGFPWLNYFLTCLTHRHSHLSQLAHTDPDAENKDVLNQILETAITINKLYQRNRESFNVFGGSRYDYMLWEAQFLNGLISFDMLYDNIERKKAEFSPDDFSPDAMYVKHDLNIYLVFFAISMQRLKNTRDDIVKSLTNDTIDYFSKLPKAINPRDVAAQLVDSARHLSIVFNPTEQLEFVMRLTTYRHIPTYAHSIMVGKIASCLTRHLATKNPDCLIGFFGITTAEQARAKADELCRFAETSGLCHDIGKISYIINPYMHARMLTDEEIDLIRRHPDDGKTMLMRDDDALYNDGYVDIIAGHHKYYDNSGGYPAGFDTKDSKQKIMIDIISAADSIDAATDDIAKTYNMTKDLDTVCAEIITGAGVRYSPVIARALEDDGLLESLAGILERERAAAYYTAYLHAWS